MRESRFPRNPGVLLSTVMMVCADIDKSFECQTHPGEHHQLGYLSGEKTNKYFFFILN